MNIKITLTSVMVDDQQKALDFYTKVLGFQKMHDIPVGEYRWITLVSPAGNKDIELALEPNANPAGKTFQAALFEQGIPATSFETSDLDAEHARLTKAGVVFTMPPTAAGPVKIAKFVDTCGNLIQLHQKL
jgi:predicted enzyme related to lactoylglutathione lyase